MKYLAQATVYGVFAASLAACVDELPVAPTEAMTAPQPPANDSSNSRDAEIGSDLFRVRDSEADLPRLGPDTGSTMRPPEEVCNGADDDDDGVVDEDTVRGQPCRDNGCAGSIECDHDGIETCVLNSADDPDVCDGRDNDCDTVIDESGSCGSYVESQCRLWMGWADQNAVSIRTVNQGLTTSTWGHCPDVDQDFRDDEVCVGTTKDGLFRRLELPYKRLYLADDNDEVGLALRCDGDFNPRLAEWIESHCAVYLGYATHYRPLIPRPEWGPCTEEPRGTRREGGVDWHCTSTGFDRQFRPINFIGSRGLSGNDVLSIAFRCNDPQNRLVANSVTRQVEVLLAWANDWGAGYPQDHTEYWLEDQMDCPPESNIDGSLRRCVTSNGDGLFHSLRLNALLDAAPFSQDTLGIAIRALRER